MSNSLGRGLAALALVLSGLLLPATAFAEEAIRVFAAGSLKAALGELVVAYEAAERRPVRIEFGPSGLLRDRLQKGETADVFAAANLEHPRALAERGLAGPVRRFARNSLCALAAPGIAVSRDNLLERLLDPAIRVGTSTPRADPSGDYAFEMFARAESRQSGARDRLAGKAMLLTGGPSSPPPPRDRSQYGQIIDDGIADIFLTYCTNALQAQRESPRQQVVALPEDLAVGADYGLVVLGGSPGGTGFVEFVLSPSGQAILSRHGFAPAAR